MNIGYELRANSKVPLRVLRGYNPESSMGTHRSAPVKSGETIYSGMLITLVWVSANSRYEWVRGCDGAYTSGTTSPMIFWAMTDASKEDVVASSSLIGLPCSGNYVLQTPYFVGTAADFDEGSYVTFDPDVDDVSTGAIKLITAFETAGQPIIGQVRALTTAGVEDIVYKDISAGLGAQNVVTIHTMFLPNLADAT